jgi:hypothetical protein
MHQGLFDFMHQGSFSFMHQGSKKEQQVQNAKPSGRLGNLGYLSFSVCVCVCVCFFCLFFFRVLFFYAQGFEEGTTGT